MFDSPHFPASEAARRSTPGTGNVGARRGDAHRSPQTVEHAPAATPSSATKSVEGPGSAAAEVARTLRLPLAAAGSVLSGAAILTTVLASRYAWLAWAAVGYAVAFSSLALIAIPRGPRAMTLAATVTIASGVGAVALYLGAVQATRGSQQPGLQPSALKTLERRVGGLEHRVQALKTSMLALVHEQEAAAATPPIGPPAQTLNTKLRFRLPDGRGELEEETSTAPIEPRSIIARTRRPARRPPSVADEIPGAASAASPHGEEEGLDPGSNGGTVAVQTPSEPAAAPARAPAPTQPVTPGGGSSPPPGEASAPTAP